MQFIICRLQKLLLNVILLTGIYNIHLSIYISIAATKWLLVWRQRSG